MQPRDDQGKIIHLNDYKGKWIVLNYWASWCDNCQEEIPQLNAFYQAHGNKDAVVLGVNCDQVNKQKLQQLVKNLKISYPVLTTILPTNWYYKFTRRTNKFFN